MCSDCVRILKQSDFYFGRYRSTNTKVKNRKFHANSMQFPCSSLPWSINGHKSCQKRHIVTQEVSHKTSFVFLKTESWYLGIFWLFWKISYMLFFILHNDVMILGTLLYEMSDWLVSFSKMGIFATLIIRIISFYQFSLQSTPPKMRLPDLKHENYSKFASFK